MRGDSSWEKHQNSGDKEDHRWQGKQIQTSTRWVEFTL